MTGDIVLVLPAAIIACLSGFLVFLKGWQTHKQQKATGIDAGDNWFFFVVWPIAAVCVYLGMIRENPFFWIVVSIWGGMLIAGGLLAVLGLLVRAWRRL